MTKTKDPEKLGRPTKYKRRFAAEARQLAKLGATDHDLAVFFDVSEVTINAWKEKFPAFLNALTEAKAEADAVVAKSLFQRAKGYEHDEDWIGQYQGQPVVIKTRKHYPPDTTACIFWLKNRQPKAWRDRSELTGADGAPLVEKNVIILPPNGRDNKDNSAPA